MRGNTSTNTVGSQLSRRPVDLAASESNRVYNRYKVLVLHILALLERRDQETRLSQSSSKVVRINNSLRSGSVNLRIY